MDLVSLRPPLADEIEPERLLPEITTHRFIVSPQLLHPLLQRFADEARDAHSNLRRVNAHRSCGLLIERDGDVLHALILHEFRVIIAHTFSRACSRSAIRSSGSSMPTESRLMASVTPIRSRVGFGTPE